MNAQELYLKDGKSAGRYFCEKCRIIALTKDDAEKCCICHNCGKPERSKYYTLCDQCKEVADQDRRAKEAQKEHDILADAKEVSDWDMVYHNGKYYPDIDTLLEDLEYEKAVIPEYVFGTYPITFRGISLSDLLGNESENIGEVDDEYLDLYNTLRGIPELQKAIDEFNKKNSELVLCYGLDKSVKVRVNI
jgi:hypothetical protein